MQWCRKEQAEVETNELLGVRQANDPPTVPVPWALVIERIPVPSVSSLGGKRYPRGTFVTWVVGGSEAPNGCPRLAGHVLCRALVSAPRHVLRQRLIPGRRCSVVVPGQPTKSLQVRCLCLWGHRHGSQCREVHSYEAWWACHACLSDSAVRILASTLSAQASISSARQKRIPALEGKL